MINKYKHIFFDLDHTLWDFNKNSSETLTYLFHHYVLKDKLKCIVEDFLNRYSEINAQLWHLYDLGKVTKDDIRTMRFHRLFETFSYYNDSLASEIDIAYLSICPDKFALIDHSIETLEYLFQKYELHIITNGFRETQTRKVKASKLDVFFKTITTSECSGYTKPHKKMFSHALNQANAHYKESIMIGDNIMTDIRGAKNIGMHQVYLNLAKKKHHHKPTYEINSLLDLKKIL